MINQIKKNGLCLGCGLCSSVLGEEKCVMHLNEKGFYEPEVLSPLLKQDRNRVKLLCPGIHVEAKAHKGVWGRLENICEAWASDEAVRYKAASGGVITSLGIYLLEQKIVDAVLQVGVQDGDSLINELKVSRNRDDVLRNAQSRYAPALVFQNILEIFEKNEDVFAFIGKPCDVAAVQNFCRVFPEYKNRVKCYLAIFCAGMPSYNATKKTWLLSGREEQPSKLRYRGNGWPGNFTAEWDDGFPFQLSYNESWGKILGKDLGFRCKICPDGIGMLADISVGDSWNTKDGYPDFTEGKGKCFCMVRTKLGVEILKDAVEKDYLINQSLDVSTIKNIQSYQYERRKLTGWRILPVQVFSGFMLHFKGLNVFKQACTANVKSGIKNMLGTFKRMKKNRNGQ